MKNILIVSQFFALNAGNYIATMLDLQDYMIQYEIECFFTFPNEAKERYWIKEFEWEKILFLDQPQKNRFQRNTKVLHDMEEFVMNHQIVLLHSNFDGYDYACGIISRKHKIPFIVSFHDPIVKLNNPIKNLYQSLMLQIHYRWQTRNALIIFVSKELSQVKKRVGIHQWEIVDNGISLRRFIKKNKEEGRAFTHLLMFAGVRFKVKGVDLLLEYMNYNKDLSVRVDVVGTGETIKRIKDNGDKRIRCIESMQDVNQMYHQYDGFISLSRYETFSYAIAEAMYVGLPIIKSNCMGTNWANENATVFVVHSPMEFWNAVRNVKEVSEDALNCSRKFIEANYSNEVWCEKIYQIYQKELKR